MKISYFSHAKDNVPKAVDCTWDSFSRDLGPHDHAQVEKLASPAFSPAEYRPNTTRAVANVVRLWCFVADLDHLTREAAFELHERIRASKLAAVVYTTWRHAEDPWRLRIVLPLSRPVQAEQWAVFWERMNAAFGGVCDPQCKDPSRLYFVPTAPAGTETSNFYHVFEGDYLDVDGILADLAVATDPERALAIQKLAEAWPAEGRHDAHLALAGGLLLSGVPDEEAVDILCQVAVAQDPDNEDREKRESAVEHTRARIDAGQRVINWTALAKHVGPDTAMLARRALEAPPKLPLSQLERFAKVLKRKRDLESTELGDALLNVFEGKEYAEPTNRADVTLRLGGLLADAFPRFDPASIADHFIPSFQKIGLTSSMCPSVDDVVHAIEHRQQQKKVKRDAEQSVQGTRIREAFGSNRSNPYTPAELASFDPNIGKRWIIQYDSSFYLFCDGEYRGPYAEVSVVNAMAIDLAPASSAGVELYMFSKDGVKSFKPLKTLVDQYGTVARQAVLDVRAQATIYDEPSRTLVEAPCPVRDIQPVYHEDIDKWLQLMAGEQYENLKTWLAIVTRLDLVCAAPFLVGDPGVGKSLLASGISRIFGVDGTTDMKDAFEAFNDALLKNPIVFADEALPKDFRGVPKTAEFRKFIQQLERPLYQKFRPVTKLLGAYRAFIAAHTINALKSTTEHLSENEIAGTNERLLYIPCNPASAAFLRQRPDFTKGWVDEDKIAQHALWLRDNHKHESQGRFYIKSANEAVVRMLTTGSGVKGLICQVLVSYLLSPGEFHTSANSALLIRVCEGDLLVNVRGLQVAWRIYMNKNDKGESEGSLRCPTINALSTALGELSTQERIQKFAGIGNLVPTKYRVIEIENLLSWSEHNGFSTEEQIKDGIVNAEAESQKAQVKENDPTKIDND